MIQFNSTFFIPVDKIDAATAWLKDIICRKLRSVVVKGM